VLATHQEWYSWQTLTLRYAEYASDTCSGVSGENQEWVVNCQGGSSQTGRYR
jgi:hypothetical protein